MFNRQTNATARKDEPRSKRGDSPSPALGLIPAAAVACVTLLIGIVATPPRYVARAAFMVDWNSLPSVPNDALAEKLHNDCRTAFIDEVVSLPDSEFEMSEILDCAGDFSGSQMDKAAVLAKLRKRLQVTLAEQTDQGDFFTIETRDDDPAAAQTAANWVLHGAVSKLKAEVKAGSGWAALRSHAVAGEAPLEKKQFDRAETGFDSLSNFGGVLFTDPIKLIKQAQVERRGVGYGLSILLVAMVGGGMAGGLSLLLRQLALVVTELTAVARSASRMKMPVPANHALRVRRQIQIPKRPILLRPLPQSDQWPAERAA